MANLARNLLLLAVVVSCSAAASDTINGDIKIVKAVRTVDLTTHLPKINCRLTLENGGKSAVKSFLVAIDPVLVEQLSFIGASVSFD